VRTTLQPQVASTSSRPLLQYPQCVQQLCRHQHNSGNATLCIVGVTFGEVGFSHQGDVARSARFNGRYQPGDAAADNYNFFHKQFRP
jgi:hypothetical protein